MPLSQRIAWEVRPTGSSSNGGGFDPSVAGAGTDRSQQTSPAVTIDNATITTSITGNVITFTAGYAPTAADLGNVVRMATGTNVTAGPYVITAQSPTTWTVAGAVNLPTSGTTTNATGRMGGALSSPNDTPAIVTGVVWIQAGAGYTIGSQWILNAGVGDGLFVEYVGYGTTRGDNGLATVTASGFLSPMLTQADQIIVRNLKIDGANLADHGIDLGANCYVENVWATRCTLTGIRCQLAGTRYRRCLGTFCGAGDVLYGAGIEGGTGVVIAECEAHDNQNGFRSSNSSGQFIACVAHNNTVNGFIQQGDLGMRLRNCTADGNGSDGFRVDGRITAAMVTNSLFTNNGGYGLHSLTDYSGPIPGILSVLFQNNGFFGNTSGARSGVPVGANDVILTADPYTSRGTGDFSLNGTTGGGAAALGVGLPGGFGLLGAGLASTGHMDLGAVQTLGAGATSSATETMRSLWRELTNEVFEDTHPNDRVDIYLDWGLQELNRQARYHISETTIALVANQQEYTVPADFVIDVFGRYGAFRVLQKGDIETWRNRGVDWQNEPAGEPAEVATYSNKLVLRPAPSAEAVAAAPNLTLRYVSTPPTITTNGPEQLGSEEYRLVVVYGALLYSIVFPESLVAQQRIAELRKEWDASMPKVIDQYARRSISK